LHCKQPLLAVGLMLPVVRAGRILFLARRACPVGRVNALAGQTHEVLALQFHPAAQNKRLRRRRKMGGVRPPVFGLKCSYFVLYEKERNPALWGE
jgi:hypothetical protein